MADQHRSNDSKSGNSGSSSRGGKSEQTKRFPKIQKVVDEYFHNWPTEDDAADADGDAE